MRTLFPRRTAALSARFSVSAFACTRANLATGDRLCTEAEEKECARAAEQQARHEEERLRHEADRRSQEADRLRHEAEQQRDAEAAARKALEEELSHLRAQVKSKTVAPEDAPTS